jgi:hypothetical protein
VKYITLVLDFTIMCGVVINCYVNVIRNKEEKANKRPALDGTEE